MIQSSPLRATAEIQLCGSLCPAFCRPGLVTVKLETTRSASSSESPPRVPARISPPEAATEWHQQTQAKIKQMVWSHPLVKHSYFKNADGEIHTVSPWRLNEYWAAVREPDWSQFVVRQRK